MSQLFSVFRSLSTVKFVSQHHLLHLSSAGTGHCCKLRSASNIAFKPYEAGIPKLFDMSLLGEQWKIHTEPSSGRTYVAYEKLIEKSLNDDRSYKIIKLPNGLKALLISDSSTDKAAASLSVGIGHLCDPDDLPGLAHFCEHMLFLGTSKYPDEAAYKQYLSQHSGSSNAFTSMDETNYHFDCHPNGLTGALARHAQFFTSPLFSPSCTERELNAVDSEFRRNLQLDSRRLFQLGKATSNREKGAAYWKFGTGSKQTLWEEPVAGGIDVRDRLLKWYAKYYSANLMNLVILSNHSLEEITKMAVREYSDISNLGLPRPVFNTPIIGPSQYETQVSYRTIKDTPQLRIEFPFPDSRQWWVTQPGGFISHYVGHEGPGSILADIKARGWASSLSAGSGNGGPGFDSFRVSVAMTASGLENYKEIIKIVFVYIDLLKTSPIQEWAFREREALGNIDWRWQQKGQPGPTTKNLASRMQDPYPDDKILVGPCFPTHFDETLIKQCLEYLTTSHCRVFIGSKTPLEPNMTWSEQEPYYSTEYLIKRLNFHDLLLPDTPKPELTLPAPNSFIPARLELLTTTPEKDPLKRPSLVRQNSLGRLFFKKDDTWCIPRATVYCLLRTPLVGQSAVTAVKSQIFTNLIEESLADYSYDVNLAGLHWSIGTESDGILLCLSGYNEKLSHLLSVILSKIESFQAQPTMFKLVHDRLCRAYANAQLNNPSTIADSHLRHLTRQTHWTYDERRVALVGLKSEDIDSFAKELFKKVQIESLVHGNLKKEDAISMVKMVESTIAGEPINPGSNNFHRSLLLPRESNLVYRPLVPSDENVNSAAAVYYEVTHTSDHELYCRLQLFAQIAKVPVFSTLRTKEQLGYIVSSSVWSSKGMAGLRILVQSERTAEYLEERIEALWLSFNDHLDEMSDEDFQKQKESLINSKREKAKNLGQETSRYWYEIDSGELDFFYRERDIAIIATLTKSNMSEFFLSFIHPSSRTRKKLSTLVRSKRYQQAALQPLRDLTKEISGEQADTFFTTKPTMEQVERFVESLYQGQIPKDVEMALHRLGQVQPLSPGVHEIEIGHEEEFRSQLERAAGLEPVNDFKSDLSAHL